MKHNIFKTALMTSALTILLLGGTGLPGFAAEEPNPSGETLIENEMPEDNGIMPLSDDDVEKNSCIES